MKYLIIDKPQRVQLKNKYPHAITRLMEELDKLGYQYDFALNTELEVRFSKEEVQILAGGKDIRDYSHIIIRGHSLGDHKEYETKRLIVDYIEQYNQDNPEKEIKMQNATAMKNLPYYNKIYTTMFCSQHDLPYFSTYYRTAGDYKENLGQISYPLIIKEYSGENDFREIEGKMKIKKNVYKVDSVKDFDQEFLKDKDFKKFFIQEFSETAEDVRTFVSKGKVVGGWRRKATEGFMTVNKGEYSFIDLKKETAIVEIAERMAKALGADFMAVDFMHLDGKPLIQEISFHPGFKAYETKIEGGKPVNVAKTIIESF